MALSQRPDHPGTDRLYIEGSFFHAGRPGQLIPVEHAEPVETPDDDYPLMLTTGRVKNHWHTMTRTGKERSSTQKLRRSRFSRSTRRMRDITAFRMRILWKSSRVAARTWCKARVTEEIARGTCFLPFHWGREHGFSRPPII